MELKLYKTVSGENLLYSGSPDLEMLDSLVDGPGDLWHSSLDQGFKNAFPELLYQTAVFWWFLNDFDDLSQSINWRINPNSFVVRKSVWNTFKGLPVNYDSETTAALDLGYRMLRHGGAVPMYIRGLFQSSKGEVFISDKDRYRFYSKNFKIDHSIYMLLKAGRSNPFGELKAFRAIRKEHLKKNEFPFIHVRKLNELHEKPEVSVIIPTMFRQDYTLQLLNDYENQTYPVSRIIVNDATPEPERDESFYDPEKFSFELVVKWQNSKGSCRARNEAIEFCKGDYIIFADDDTRILPDFVENHLRFLQTYSADACTGLDVHAGHHEWGLDELKEVLREMDENRWKAGAAQTFNNANSCVKTEWVQKLIGNDINFDGGYGEDADFGLRILKKGGILLYNPYSVNLHLKPPAGGYRHWGIESSVIGKKRKKQAWELEHPVKLIKPVPSPTIVYGIMKHFKPEQVREYRSRYFFLYLFKKSKKTFLIRLLKIPYKLLQFNKALFYAKNLRRLGSRY